MGGHDAAGTRSSSTGGAARNPESGGEAVQVTDCRLDTNHGVWSPDGKRFAFSYAFGGPVAEQFPRTRGPRHRDRPKVVSIPGRRRTPWRDAAGIGAEPRPSSARRHA